MKSRNKVFFKVGAIALLLTTALSIVSLAAANGGATYEAEVDGVT